MFSFTSISEKQIKRKSKETLNEVSFANVLLLITEATFCKIFQRRAKEEKIVEEEKNNQEIIV